MRPNSLDALLPEFRGVGRTLVMGILNVTPDSFSDGGRWATPGEAIRRGEQMISEGADIIDIGGESTRPGAAQVTAEEELARVLPVVEALAAFVQARPASAQPVVLSVDTTRAEVARRALDAGARIINDVSGGLQDPDMLRVIVAAGSPYICMFNTGPAAVDDRAADLAALAYRPAARQVYDGLAARLEELRAAGVGEEQIILDPGLGFVFAGEPNWELLGHLDELVSLGQPVLVGASRKRFLSRAVEPVENAREGGALPTGYAPADAATIAVTALAAAAGAWAVRVHDVSGNAAAVRVASAWETGQSS